VGHSLARRSKSKNAQEAHEAIRPTDASRHPASLPGTLDRAERRLYDLIWRRAMASQMASACMEQVRGSAADCALRCRLSLDDAVADPASLRV
jgi:DNA topoisomerase I